MSLWAGNEAPVAVARTSRTAWTVYAASGIAAAVAWGWLLLVAAETVRSDVPGALGPGTEWLEGWLAGLPGIERGWVRALVAACVPVGGAGLASWPVVFPMWCAMSVAMMLPSAAPMLRTYAQIAETAREGGKTVVPIAVLVGGYLAIWFAASALFALVQVTLSNAGLAGGSGLAGAVILLLAGAYQFSGLREACLEKCRNPFSVLFGRWSDRVSGIFRLGLQQGLFCLGCCWALMLVMLVVGTMNLAWMAALTLFTVLEKTGTGRVTGRVSGGILLAWGGALAVAALI